MQSFVNIYVQTSNGDLLYFNLDKNLDLDVIVKCICSEFKIENSSKYALLWNEEERKQTEKYTQIFLTEETKNDITEGKTLLLSVSPENFCQNMKQITKKENSEEDLGKFERLREYLQDETFLKEFQEQNCFEFLSEYFSCTDDDRLSIQIILTFNTLIYYDILIEENISDEFLEKLFSAANSMNTDQMLLCEIIRLLKGFLTLFPELYSATLDGLQLPSLVHSLICDKHEIHVSTISFINKVFELTPNEHQKLLSQIILEKNEMRIIVFKYVIKKSKNFSDDLNCELINLQNMLLYEEINLHNTQPTSQNINLLKLNEELKIYDRSNSINVVAKNLGFINFNDLSKEFISESNGLLLLNCLLYYLEKNKDSAYYFKIGPSLLDMIKISINTITSMLKNFKTRSYKISLLPILFEIQYSFQELICAIIENHKKVIGDLKSHDNFEITRYFEEKIKRVLYKLPTDYTRLNCDLDRLDFELVSKIMKKESIKWNEKLNNLSAVKNLRAYFEPCVKEMVKNHIYNKLKQGLPIDILSLKTKKHATKEENTIKVSSSLDSFEYGSENNWTKILFNDIAKILSGEAAAAKVDERLVKKVPLMNILLIECKNNDKHTICTEADNHKLILDILSFYDNKPIDDNWQPSGYKALLNCFIDTSLMDVNETDFPAESPTIPQPPENYDFVYTDIN